MGIRGASASGSTKAFRVWVVALVLASACQPGTGSDASTSSAASPQALCVESRRDPGMIDGLIQKAVKLAPPGKAFAISEDGQKMDVPAEVDLKAVLPEWKAPKGDLPLCPGSWTEVVDQLVLATSRADTANKDLALVPGFEVVHPNIRNAYFIVRFDKGVLQWAFIHRDNLIKSGTGSAELKTLYGLMPGI